MAEIICDEVVEKAIKMGALENVTVKQLKNCLCVYPHIQGDVNDKSNYHISTEFIVEYHASKHTDHLDAENVITLICYIIIGASFFVYGNIESVFMAIAQMLIFNLAMNYMLKTSRNAVEAKIITDEPEALKEDIICNLKHGATIIDATGMFTGEDKKMVISIINVRQMSDLIKISKKHPNSFIYFSEVNGVWGNFRWNKTDEVK